ncbi:GNAT family N-acetyltransferase [Pseudoxanthomonas sp. 22568]|uniref:GNAT family N-acetyltransferase n=1 Tax=Pseudoxanthomonas sp. 22568 TaxID=3453945 RepID=UPI003F84F217
MSEVSLVPMSERAFRTFLHVAVENYAAENVSAGRWPAEGARERSQEAFAQLLPQGAATPDHYLFEIVAGEEGTVGSLWYGVYTEGEQRQVHVYDVLVHPAHRRRGYAAAAFTAMEAQVRAQGIDRIGLHVFAHNAGAQALYARLGYLTVSHNLIKQL